MQVLSNQLRFDKDGDLLGNYAMQALSISLMESENEDEDIRSLNTGISVIAPNTYAYSMKYIMFT